MALCNAFIGLDTHKKSIAVAVADDGRDGEVRFYGEIANEPAAINNMVRKLAGKHDALRFCYEAGPCGYGLHRQISALGHDCIVIAPSHIPSRPGDRVKNDRRDALSLARLHRAGELTRVCVPDEAHEAIRDLVCARTAAMDTVKRFRQQLQGFLLRHGRIYPGKTCWTKSHFQWIRGLAFAHPAHYIVVQEHLSAIREGKDRQEKLEQQIVTLLPTWTLSTVVHAIQAMRGISLITAVIFVSEVGDCNRFQNPRQLMSYLGLAPSESSSGNRIVRGAITKAGSSRVRRALVEGSWAYRLPARVGSAMSLRHDGLSKDILDIAWKGQLRLCQRYRQMRARGKHQNVITIAIAREMVGFIWAIARAASPPTPVFQGS